MEHIRMHMSLLDAPATVVKADFTGNLPARMHTTNRPLSHPPNDEVTRWMKAPLSRDCRR
jgi:hypothetical protein